MAPTAPLPDPDVEVVCLFVAGDGTAIAPSDGVKAMEELPGPCEGKPRRLAAAALEKDSTALASGTFEHVEVKAFTFFNSFSISALLISILSGPSAPRCLGGIDVHALQHFTLLTYERGRYRAKLKGGTAAGHVARFTLT